MIARARLLVLLARPAVVVLLGLFAATGLAQAGVGDDPARLAAVLFAVVSFLVCCVVVNDLGDEAIDAVNVPGRSLVAGHRQALHVVAATSGGVAVLTAALLQPLAAAVVAAGLVLALAYSVRPVRLADRGAVASLVLPAGYVAVPFLVGVLAVRPVEGGDLPLLAALYVGFVGRILLKDFRDVRGDALFGKRTFLVRHGRRATCALSAACWVAGAAIDPLLFAPFVALALVLLQRLSLDRGARRDEWLVSAIAVVGRGMVVTLVATLSDAPRGLVVALTVVVVGQAVTMARQGPARGRQPRLDAGDTSALDVVGCAARRAPRAGPARTAAGRHRSGFSARRGRAAAVAGGGRARRRPEGQVDGGRTSGQTPGSARRRTRAGASTARTPCSMRSARRAPWAPATANGSGG